MRLFLVTSPGGKPTWPRLAIEALYGPALSVIAHEPGLNWDNLPAHCVVESSENPTAALLTNLQLHGFKIISVQRHPLDALIDRGLHDGVQPASSPFFEYAVSDAARDQLRFSLAWEHIDGALVLRHENWAFYRPVEIERLRHHCGEFTASSGQLAAHLSAPLASQEEPDFWRSQFSLETARAIHDAHAGLFAALGYFPPLPTPVADSTTEASAETKRLRHELLALQGAHRRLEDDIEELHRNRGRTVLKMRLHDATLRAQTNSTEHYHQLVHNAGVGKHLYRALKVLLGDRHYRQKPPAVQLPAEDTNARPLPDRLKGYQPLTFGDLEVRFHLEALHDNRGTGRVAQELLAGLQALEKPPAASPAKTTPRIVHFFAAPHWGPAELPANSCVVIHDVIPSLTPGYREAQVAIFDARCRGVIKQAQKIITISATSARDIARVLEHPEDKITVIHNGVTLLPVASVPAVKLPPAPFVAYVGGGDSHKNIDVVLKALRHPAARHVHFAMIGDNENYVEEVAALGLLDRVHFLGRLSDAELGYVIKNASALVFPSFYEGFGLPPLEAALLGTPSICSRRPAMTEMLAGASLFADPDSADDWAACLHLLTTHPDFAREIGQLAQTRAERLKWSVAASAYLNELQSMA